MLRTKCVLANMFLIASSAFGQESPATIHFFDDLDGKSPITWVLSESIPFGADFDFQVGPDDLTISGAAAVAIMPTVDDRPLLGADLTLTMQAVAQPEVYLAFYSRTDRGGSNQYFGGIDQRGRSVLQEWENREDAELLREFQDFDLYDGDIFIEFETIGDQLDVRVWALDAERPESPNISLTDDSNLNGGFGFAFLGSGPNADENIATIRSVDVVYHRNGLFGDMNGDGELDHDDVAEIVEDFHVDFTDLQFDVNGDLRINAEDVFTWIEDAKVTYIGDANLDGEFNSSDFVQVFQLAEYEDQFNGNSTWASGDWNSDGEFDSRDFVVAFQEGGYEQGRRVAAHAVSEPSNRSIALPIVALTCSLLRRRFTNR